jgi:integrase
VAKAQPPTRPKNEDLREREHLRPEEIERLIEAARGNRYGGRDALMILMAYRHGLRASEVTDLKWEQVDFDRSEIHVNRLKGGTPATHPLTGRNCASSAVTSATARRRPLCLYRSAGHR